MDKLSINGGKSLHGKITVSGAKNVAMKVILAGLLTDDKIIVHGVPNISSVTGTANILKPLGANVKFTNNKLIVDAKNINKFVVPLEVGSLYRTATMVLGPLLTRFGKAQVPNPGGCRIGLRPIDRHIEALRAMGAQIEYNSEDGYFYAKAKRLHGTTYHFDKNSHTGTETILLAAVLADGKTVIENASAEPEVDDLIQLLVNMGASINRVEERKIVIQGVKKLHGTTFTIMPDRNEVVTYAIGAIATGGDIVIEGTQRQYLKAFLHKLDEAGAGWEPVDDKSTRFYNKGQLRSTHVKTKPHPGFMTDWQAPWTLLMTQSQGTSTVHETVFEDRFSYVSDLLKMGADISFYHPQVTDPESLYNFHCKDKDQDKCQAIKINGATQLHNAVVKMRDLRSGATLILAALTAQGESFIYDLEHIDRGYERIDERLTQLGADIKRQKE